MGIQINPLHESFVAEVVGAPPTLEMDDAAFRHIEHAFYTHSILVFRDLKMTPEQHIAFTRRFGPTHIMEPLQYNLPGYPEVMVVSNVEDGSRPKGLKRAGWGWHSDGEDKAVPNAASFLYAIELPPEGGDTMFADMYAAFAALPDDVRTAIMGKRARASRIELHNVHYPDLPALTDEQKRQRQDVRHPMARTHPKTGWTSVYVGRWCVDVDGMPEKEGRELVAYLQNFVVQPRFVFTQRWQPGDAVLWDNRCTQHCALPFDDSKYRRHMLRTTLEGEAEIRMAERPVVRPEPHRWTRVAAE
jgi:alpha-ketoglutarate-dependent taurine dioxygenase